jgi:hypothetical protein
MATGISATKKLQEIFLDFERGIETLESLKPKKPGQQSIRDFVSDLIKCGVPRMHIFHLLCCWAGKFSPLYMKLVLDGLEEEPLISEVKKFRNIGMGWDAVVDCMPGDDRYKANIMFRCGADASQITHALNSSVVFIIG